jgi:hypothetical protein
MEEGFDPDRNPYRIICLEQSYSTLAISNQSHQYSPFEHAINVYLLGVLTSLTDVSILLEETSNARG